jgi:hypothetical protein
MLPMTLAIIILVAAGLLNGVWIDRWNLSSEPSASAAKVEQIPVEFGDWKMLDSKELDEQSKAIGEIAGSINRIYGRGGEDVSCLIVCGRPGAIGAHTPDICFVGKNQTMHDRKLLSIPIGAGEKPAEFSTAIFRRTDGGISSSSRAFWAWSADGSWSAPEYPRLRFLGQQVLYKLYVTYPLPDEKDDPALGPGAGFIKVLLPGLDPVLFGKGTSIAEGRLHYSFANIK